MEKLSFTVTYDRSEWFELTFIFLAGEVTQLLCEEVIPVASAA